MSRFSYAALSSQDFEELARDLLQAQWGVSLEAFRSGRDQGIDLRYSRPKVGTTIIQCKHYVGSGFPTLLTHLEKQELPKIKRLNPDRYVVVTSVALSPQNKTTIREALRPFVRDDVDIFSAGDLDGLLSIHSKILRDNYKLWLTSTEVLDRIVHNAEICHAEFIVEKIQQNIPRFVQGSSFETAMGLLETERVVVISGVPGIGKTTLADMLVYSFLERGFQPVVIQAEIAEGRRLYRKDEKQIFYYDDFLGQFFLGDRSEYFGRNQDASLIDFIEMVRQSKNAFFILTTREHLLQQALTSSERFSHGRLLDARYVLDLSEYSFGDRARILYNHIFFSELPSVYREEILRDDFFLKVIKHPHFNPRLVEWLSTFVRVRTTPPANYQVFVSNLLSAPHELWRHAFENQLSDRAKDVLLALYSLGEYSDIGELDLVWDAIHEYRSRKYNRDRTSHGIRPVLQELDGAFLMYSGSLIKFLNPSIREFVANSIVAERTTASDLFESAIRFKQVVNLYKLAQSALDSALMSWIKEDSHRISLALVRVLDGPDMRWENTRYGTRGYSIDLPFEARIEFVLDIALLEKSEELAVLAADCFARLQAKMQDNIHFPRTINVLNSIKGNTWIMQHGGQSPYRAILASMLTVLQHASSQDWLSLYKFIPGALGWSKQDQIAFDDSWAEYCENGLADEVSNCDSVDEYSSLAHTLQKLSEFGTDFTEWISDLENTIAEFDQSEDRLEEGYSQSTRAVRVTERHVTDQDVRQMFYTILDPVDRQ
jgi:conflict system STAND superfamily ATPase/restriction endonuclease